jgi:hypothetical protein
VTKPQPFHNPRAEAFNKSIGSLDKRHRQSHPIRFFQIYFDSGSAPHREIEFERARGPKAARSRAVEPEYRRAEIGQERGAERARPDARHLNNFYSRKRSHGAFSL